MHRWLLLMILVMLPVRSRADEYLKVGAWNIENLGDRKFGQATPALEEHILLAGVDVLALEEIWDNDSNDATMTNTKLTDVFRRVNRTPGHDWEYVLFPKREAAELRQHLGVAWNKKKVSKIGEPLKIPVEYANAESWKRTPFALKFSVRQGKSDFVLIPLHMKSNLPVEGLPAPVELRRLEAKALVDKLDWVRQQTGDQDVILLGDLNCLESDEPALQLYHDAGFTDLNAANAITYNTKMYKSPFDRILVPSRQPEFKYSQQYTLTPTDADQHRQRYSDHFLVLVAVRVMDDDD